MLASGSACIPTAAYSLVLRRPRLILYVTFAYVSIAPPRPALQVVNTVMASLRDVLSRPPTESSLLEKYERLCVVIDEVIDEGMVAATDLDAIRKGTKHKGPWEI